MPAKAGSPPLSSRSIRRVAGLVIGLLLILAAGRAVLNNADVSNHARDVLRGASPGLLAAMLLLPMVSWMLTSGVVFVLTRPRASVPLAEVTAAVGASWLLNYLPLSPGLVGRVAYFKATYKLPVRTSLRIIIETAAAGLVGGAVLLMELTLQARAGLSGVILLGVWPIVLFLRIAAGRAWVSPIVPVYAVAIAIKSLDTLVWAVRYGVVFTALGLPFSPLQCGIVAVVAQVSMLIPGLANGLGVREWVVGFVGASLPVWMIAHATSTGPSIGSITGSGRLETALAGDILMRITEVVGALVAGLIGAWFLARVAARRDKARDPRGVRTDSQPVRR